MSEMGQKLTSEDIQATSALRSRADILRRTGHVGFVPAAADISRLILLWQL
jgi:hypothetical protein